MLEIDSYSSKGNKLAQIALPKEWDEKNNPTLLAQAMRVYIDRSHTGLRKTKTRSEVNRTTKKLYKQKGTGGARHGARSAPIFVGGGIAHGPRALSRELTLPVAMKRKALGVAMALAVKEKRVMAADLDFKKASETQKFIEKVVGKKNPRVTFIVKKEDLKVAKNMRNVLNVRIVNFMDLNAYDVFFGGNLVIDRNIFKSFKAKEINPPSPRLRRAQ